MKKYYIIVIATLLVFTLIWSCIKNQNKEQEPLARVYDKYLYVSDVQNIFNGSMTGADSLQVLKAFVDRWVRKQLMLNRAEKNLSPEQKDVSQQLDDYRSSLLIFKYEQEYIQQRMDTFVSASELEKYYTDNLSNFTLNENVVKALFIKIRKDDTYYERIRMLYRSDKEDDIKTLDNLAYQVAIKYDYFNDMWVPLSRILREFPEPIENVDVILTRSKHIEYEDETFAYLLNVRDIARKGETSPFSYEKNNVRSILLNKRKQRLIMDIEAKIYNDARNHNHFNIYVE
ncbi:MAG TPA: hypothetical protein PL017_00280 [Tenuifilaceae bacterium]|nr:hypothetical protein [Tenuifilaceae bacterium]HPE17275.1 hypothetical protein [Tenuifilaceae bacterium]HPJ44501.1 hypothetical protein [Tenuifilaceae bacterium]HPQ33039.1 hypothetical protein [Tenuifilaceae bacterium]HRX67731.1 hypothetical protein [Tenuifilaceae bacterium]